MGIPYSVFPQAIRFDPATPNGPSVEDLRLQQMQRDWAEIDALRARVKELEAALTQAEACMAIVEPRSDKAEYLRILGVVRAALAKAAP